MEFVGGELSGGQVCIYHYVSSSMGVTFADGCWRPTLTGIWSAAAAQGNGVVTAAFTTNSAWRGEAKGRERHLGVGKLAVEEEVDENGQRIELIVEVGFPATAALLPRQNTANLGHGKARQLKGGYMETLRTDLTKRGRERALLG